LGMKEIGDEQGHSQKKVFCFHGVCFYW
jgi:hypothetical protein